MPIDQMIEILKTGTLSEVDAQEITEALRAGQAMRDAVRIVRIVGKSVVKIAEPAMIAAANDWSDATAKRDRYGKLVDDAAAKQVQTYEVWIEKVRDIAKINSINLPQGDDLRSFYEDGISAVWYFEEDERVASQFGKRY